MPINKENSAVRMGYKFYKSKLKLKSYDGNYYDHFHVRARTHEKSKRNIKRPKTSFSTYVQSFV